MKIATLYRKDGKVILETDNDAIAQVATDTPQDVVVMDAYERMAARYLTDARQVGRPPALGCGYRMAVGGVLQRQDVPPSGMAALQRIVTELRRRNAGPPAPKPILGVELVEWADRIEAAMKEIDNG